MIASDGRFSADVAIRRVSDGVVRVYRSDHESYDEHGDYADFLWSEGNFGCDCNRGDFFARVVGEPDPDTPCGETQYAIDWIRRVDTGEVLYSEID